jgi:hypothetical protein
MLDTQRLLVDDYDRHVDCELAELIGPGTSRNSNRPRNLRLRRQPRA